MKRWRPKKAPSTRIEEGAKRQRGLLVMGATPEEASEGSQTPKAFQRLRFRLLAERSARVQMVAGWAEKPCPCTLREARACPVHEPERVRPLGSE